MSSILKALKKLEAEKSTRRPDSIRIDAEILRGDVPGRLSPLGVILTALLLFVCGGAATYFFLKQDAAQLSLKRDAATPVVPTERITAETIVPAARIGKTTVTPATPEKSGPTASAVQKLPSNQAPPPGPMPGSSAKSRAGRTLLRPPVTAGQATAPVRPAQPALERPPVPAPLLRVTGIAFQDGVDSAAIINGVQVGKGSMIEGVRVVAIERDRVVFSLGGENFEIALGRSNR
jgi:hypothetical protein